MPKLAPVAVFVACVVVKLTWFLCTESTRLGLSLGPRDSCYCCEVLPRFFGVTAPFGAGRRGRPTARVFRARSAVCNTRDLVACWVIGNNGSGSEGISRIIGSPSGISRIIDSS